MGATVAAWAAESAEATIAALEKRAAAGDVNAQNNLGASYENGAGGPRDLRKALEFYRQAADGGNEVGAFNLAVMYDAGTGIAQDQKVANEWYEKSANQGYAPAILNLGMNFARGEGAAADLVEGMKWVDLARFFTQQEKDMRVKYRVRGAYEELKKHLTKSQLAEAGKRSDAWFKAYKAKHSKG
jgi:TPR repeat protein